MTAKGHIALALLPAIPIASFLNTQEQIVFLGAVGFGSLLPDIDEPNSFIGRRLGFVSIPLKILGVKHRTFTHYLIFPFFIFIFSLFLSRIWQIAGFGVALGILMHDIGDMMTKGGIKGFLYPFFKNRTFRILPKKFAFYTNSFTEYIIITFLFLIDSYMYYSFMFNSLYTLGVYR